MPWTPEEAREMGRKGGLKSAATRARQRAKPADERARRLLRESSPRAAAELLKAAFGEAPYADLGPKERATALLRVLEYGLGRPPSAAKPEKKDDESEKGLTIQ